MSTNYPALIVMVPFISALLVFVIGWWNRRLSCGLVIAVLVTVFLLSIGIMKDVMTNGTIHYWLGGWEPPWGIEYAVDYLNAFMLVIISFISLVVTIYSKKSVEKELPDKIVPFYSLYLLLITGLIGIVVSGDLFNVFVFLEIASISCYALIAVGRKGASYSSFKYVVMGTVGATFYLLGVGYIYIVTGSLNMADASKLLPALYDSKVVLTAGIFMIVGIGLKMAIYPLHAWVPGAYSDAPSAVSALIAPLMTKVAAYLMIRIMFTVFKPCFFIEVIPVTTILTWMAAVAIILGSIYAIAQTDLKKMLSYSIIAQVGYIALGIGLANRFGLTGAVLHILNEAFTKGCVFLVAGAIVYKMGSCNINEFKNLYRKMPFTMSAFLIGAFSMVGIPPTCGFFSKIYLIIGSIDAGSWIFVAVLLFSSILNVIYFFRVIQIATFETPMPDYSRDKAYEPVCMDEVPLSMLIPIQIMAAGILLSGIFSSKIISTVIQFVIPVSF
ncbi:MAG: monovalent cation/H+ antiporter subunit D family protein [Thermodesulfobacteriota bacterium]|nr:monovalent cation/H+ antiporter subunit D family protein [Thermodesulfobacteriota bacterium]